MPLTIPYDPDALNAFCRRHGVSGFYVFGSVARGESRPDSDIDVLLEFEPQQRISLFDLGAMQQDLEDLFGRRVDLLTRRGLDGMQNLHRKQHILDSLERVHAA